MSGKPIFISYARTDRQFADQIAHSLEAAGFVIWIDRQDVPVGAQWWAAISQAIVASSAMVAIVSRHSIVSDVVARELEVAERSRVAVVPVSIEGRGAPLGRFQQVQCIDFVEQPFLSAAAQLAAALRSKSRTLGFSLGTMTKPDLLLKPLAPAQIPLAKLMDGGWRGQMADVYGQWDLDIVVAPMGRFQGFIQRPSSFETETVIGSWRVEEPQKLTLEGTINPASNPFARTPWKVEFFFTKVSPTQLQGSTLPGHTPCIWRRQ